MKQFLILILAVLSQSLALVLEIKPDVSPDICDSMPNWALIPHPNDCKRFYVCANRILEEYSCIENYHFDQKQKRCVRGSCSSSSSSSAETDCPNWVRRVNDDCQLYEVCHNNGNYSRESCTEGSYFLESLGVCLPIPKNHDTPQYKCSCIYESYTVLKNPDDCGSFYMCIDGRVELQNCQPGDFFNDHLNACVHDLDGVCDNKREITEEMLEICSKRSNPSNALQRHNLYPDEKSCSNFYFCFYGQVILKNCPLGFYFNRESRMCEADRFGRFCMEIKEEIKKILEEKKQETFIKKVISKHTKKIGSHNATSWNIIHNEKSEESQEIPFWNVPIPPVVLSSNSGNKKASLKRPTLNSPGRYEMKLPTNSHYKKLSSKFARV